MLAPRLPDRGDGGRGRRAEDVLYVYCSKQCQVAAWKGGHKQECAGLKFDKIMEVFNSSNGMRDAAKMEEEGLAVAGALRSVWPVKAG